MGTMGVDGLNTNAFSYILKRDVVASRNDKQNE